MINVESKIRCYEVNDEEIQGLDYPTIKITNHWNEHEFVVLVINGNTYTVSAKDLKAAIENATNVAR